jgi:DNA-directed RNA polymerase subunit L
MTSNSRLRSLAGYVCRVTYTRDTKIQNAATFEIRCEDHTIGEPLVSQLHEDERVIFAACKVPHPLEHRLQIKVRTQEEGVNKEHPYIPPAEAYNVAVNNLYDLFLRLKTEFEAKVADACAGDPSLDFDPASKHQPIENITQDQYGQDMDDDVMFDDDGFGAAR